MKHKNSFTIYPEHCNYMEYEGKPMVHGGTMLLKMDRVAADFVRKLLRDSECNSARTVAVNSVSFITGAKLGDYLELECKLDYLGIKSIEISVTVKKEDGKKMATGVFTFVSFKDDKPHKHGLKHEL